MHFISDKATIYRDVNIKDSLIEENAVVADYCDLKSVHMFPFSEFGRRCVVRNTTIGEGSYTGSGCCIEYVDIGKYCCISSDVNIYGVAKTRTHNYQHASLYTPHWFRRIFNADIPNHAVGGDSIDWKRCMDRV